MADLRKLRANQTIFIYGFRGRYSGEGEYDWESPEINDTHNCMLFLRQTEDTYRFDLASEEIRRYGFAGVENLRGNALQIRVLNTDAYRGFAKFYEAALEQGSCLVFYPKKL